MNAVDRYSARHQEQDFFEEETIDLRHYWHVLMRFKWGILGLGFLSAVVTALVLITMDDIYESSATLMIESTNNRIPSLEEMFGIQAQSREYFNTQFELLSNRNLAERVVRELNLVNHPEFAPDERGGFSLRAFISGLIPSGLFPSGTQSNAVQIDPERARLARVLTEFNSRLTVSPIRNTDLVNVTFESTDPVLAATVVNSLANAYIENYLEQRLSSTERTSAWMTERLSELRTTLDESEQRLQAFREQERLVDIAGVAALNVQELDELTTQNNLARRARAEAETLYRQIQQMEGDSVAEALRLPAVLNHPVLANIRQSLSSVEQQIADLSQRYGRNHPRMIALNAQKAEAERSLAQQVRQVLATIETDYRTALANEEVTQERLNRAIAEYQEVSRKSFEMAELERAVQTNRQLYDMFFTRLRETDQTEDFQAAPAIIVDPGVPAVSPSKPRRSLITAIALLAGLMFGTMLAFLRDMLDNTIHTPADIEERLGASTLGLVPLAKENKTALKEQKNKTAYLGFVEDSHSSFAEAFRTIRTGMMLSSIDKPYKLIAVTSSVPNEGKSTMSVNLAAVMGQMKKTVLIDADMRRPSLAKSLDLPPNSPGLSNWIAGTAELMDCLYPSKEGNFMIMPGGQIVPNPLELISSPRFRDLLAALGEQFEQVILDTPPTQAVSDALVIGSMMDAVVYVVKADSTPIAAIKNGLNRLHYANANVIGVTLNQVDTEKQSSYYYYGGYYDSYGYSGGKA